MEQDALAGAGTPPQEPQTPPNRLKRTYDYVMEQQLPEVAESFPKTYEEFEVGMQQPENLKALHQLYKDQKWAGADLSDDEFNEFMLEGVGKSRPDAGPASSLPSEDGGIRVPFTEGNAPATPTSDFFTGASQTTEVPPVPVPEGESGFPAAGDALSPVGQSEQLATPTEVPYQPTAQEQAEANRMDGVLQPGREGETDLMGTRTVYPTEQTRQSVKAAKAEFDAMMQNDATRGQWAEENGVGWLADLSSHTYNAAIPGVAKALGDGFEYLSTLPDAFGAAGYVGNPVAMLERLTGTRYGGEIRKAMYQWAENHMEYTSPASKQSVLDDPTNGRAWAGLAGDGLGSFAPIVLSGGAGSAGPIATGMLLSVSGVKEAARDAGISDAEAALTATIVAPISGLLEKVGLESMVQNPATMRLLNTALIGRARTLAGGLVTKSGMTQAVSELMPQLVKRFGTVAGRVATASTGEGLTEYLQTWTEGGARIVADKVRGNEGTQTGQGRYNETAAGVQKQALQAGIGGAMLGPLAAGRPATSVQPLTDTNVGQSSATPATAPLPAQLPLQPGPVVRVPAAPAPQFTVPADVSPQEQAAATQQFPDPVQIMRPTGQVMYPNAQVVGVSPDGTMARIVSQDAQGQPVDTMVPVGYIQATAPAAAAAAESTPTAPESTPEASSAGTVAVEPTQTPTVSPELTDNNVLQSVAPAPAGPAPAYGTPAENRKAGRFEKDGVTYERQAPLAERAVYGNEATVEFSTGVQQPVRYALIEAADLQPSHTGGTPNLNHFLPEAQPKNRSAAFDPASQQAISEIAAMPDAGRLGAAPNAYSGAPVVNGRGEALQGNGRGDGILQHYRQGGTQYKSDITAQAAAVGIPAEAVAQMLEPVLVRVADVSDARARELGNYTAADTESGGVRRMEAKQAAGRLDEKGRENLTRLLTPQGDATLTETIRGNQDGVIRLLQQQGLVNPTQLQTMVNKEGVLTPAGVEDIAGLYRQMLFLDGDPNLPEVYRDLPAAAQNGLDRAVASIVGLPEESSIRPEVQNAVLGVREFLRSGADFNTWAGQADMFNDGQAPSQRYSALELKLIQLLASEKRPTYIARAFAEYAAAVKGETATLFGDTPGLSRPDAVAQTFQVSDNGRQQPASPNPVAPDGRPTPPAAPATPGTPAAQPAAAPDASNPDPNGAGGSAAPGSSGAQLDEERTYSLSAQRISEVQDKRAALLAELDNLSPLPTNAYASVVPLPTIDARKVVLYGKIVGTYLEEGLYRAQDILDRLRQDLGAGLNGVTDQDLRVVIQQAKDQRAQEAADARTDRQTNLAQQKADLEVLLFGTATATAGDFGAAGAGRVTGALARLQENTVGRVARAVGGTISEAANRAAVSRNAAVRELVYALNAISKGFVQTQQQQQRSEAFGGQVSDKSMADSQRIYSLLAEGLRDTSLPADQQTAAMKESMRRLDRVLDPQFYASRTRAGFEQLLQDRLEPAAFASLDATEIDDLFAQHTSMLTQEQLANSGPLDEADLTPAEAATLAKMRALYSFIHDANFAIGKIGYDTWQAGRDEQTGQATYAARVYNPTELPADLQTQWQKAGKSMETGLYKQRTMLDAWKVANKAEDPVYAAVTRLRQTQANRAIFDYAQWLTTTQPHLVAVPAAGAGGQEAARLKGEERGFVQLGDGYGALSNAWVAPHVAEDFKGAFFTNKAMQAAYDLTKSYGAWEVRNALKKLVTVFNPGTHLSNITINSIPLAWMAGVDPVTMGVEQAGAVQELKEYSPTVRFLLERGVLQTNIAIADLKKNLADFNNAFAAEPEKGLLGKVTGGAESFYQQADNVAKVALFRALVKQGVPAEVAADRVASSLQNSRRVGKIYDLTSNLPLIGQPFGRWSADLMRILGSAATNRPLHIVTFAMLLRAVGDKLSEESGETPTERKLRESRGGKIPMPDWLGGNISLSFKISQGNALDVSRLLVPFYLYGGMDTDDELSATISKFSPLWVEGGAAIVQNKLPYSSNPTGERATVVAKAAKDMVLAPALQLLLDADFRGKSIRDANQTKTRPTTLTDIEQYANQARFFVRSYLPGTATLIDDLAQAAQDKENFFGKKRTVGQTLARFIGIKLEQFGTEQYTKSLEGALNASQARLKGELKLLNQLQQDVAQGKASPSAFLPRVRYRLQAVRESLVKLAVAAQMQAAYQKEMQKKAATPAAPAN